MLVIVLNWKFYRPEICSDISKQKGPQIYELDRIENEMAQVLSFQFYKHFWFLAYTLLNINITKYRNESLMYKWLFPKQMVSLYFFLKFTLPFEIDQNR